MPTGEILSGWSFGDSGDWLLVDGHLQSVGVTRHFEGGIVIQPEMTNSLEAFQTIYSTSTSKTEEGEQGSYEI